MKLIFNIVFILSMLFGLQSGANASTLLIPKPYILNDTTQLIVVVTNNWDASTGELIRFQRSHANNSWQQIGHPIAVVVGKNGLGWDGNFSKYQPTGPMKKEGDQKAPAGAFEVGPAFGFSAQSDRQTPIYYLPIKETTVCVDDPQSKYYGRIIDTAKISHKDWKSGEQMRTVQQYEHGLVVNYNMGERIPGIGSCIFMHIWKGPSEGTVGCTAMAKSDIVQILHWLHSKDNPILVQLPREPYQQLQQAWNLPKL